MLNKKAPVGAFSGSTGGPFSQKKRSGDKHEAVLAKSHSKKNQYLDMESNFGDSIADDILAGGGDGSLLGSTAMTPKAKRVKNNLDCGSPLGFLDYNMDNNDGGPFPFSLGISLDRIWLDPKIIKTQVEVVIKKSFTLDINLSAVEGKSVTFKTQVIRKLFSRINSFGGATIPSKFERIIRLMFTSSESIEKTASLARENDIVVNSDLKRQEIHSDRAVVIKEIPMDMPKEMIVTAVSEFGEIKSIKIQLIGLWQKAIVEFTELEQAVSLAARWSFLIGKDLVRVTMAVGDHKTWASRDQFRALLFTLSVRTIVHDLGDLLEETGGKTCVINRSLETGNRVHCTVVCFDSDEVLESAFRTELILGGVKLSWARLDLVCCEQYGKFGHSALECDAKVVSAFKFSKLFIRPINPDTRLQLAKLYAKKNWSQLLGFHAGSGSSSPPSSDLSSGGVLFPLPVVNSPLSARLVLLECSVELLFEQISNIFSHLDNINSAPLALSSQLAPSVVVPQSPTSVPLVVTNSDLDFDMAVDDPVVQPTSFSPGVTGLLLGPSSSKVLTSKVGGLKSKLVALDISVGSILAKLDQLCAGSDSLVISSSQ
ncbi:hypothetical protein G9A89_004009 [Geosiphon pyriformis]|nr:hypothetical protein G9A89_004009 [Geosiphon pyriformis]